MLVPFGTPPCFLGFISWVHESDEQVGWMIRIHDLGPQIRSTSWTVHESNPEQLLVFKASALWADAFYKSISPDVCLSVYLSVNFWGMA